MNLETHITNSDEVLSVKKGASQKVRNSSGELGSKLTTKHSTKVKNKQNSTNKNSIKSHQHNNSSPPKLSPTNTNSLTEMDFETKLSVTKIPSAVITTPISPLLTSLKSPSLLYGDIHQENESNKNDDDEEMTEI